MSRTCDSLEYSASTGDSHTVALAHAVALLLSGHVVSLAAPPRTVALKVFEAATAGPRLLWTGALHFLQIPQTLWCKVNWEVINSINYLQILLSDSALVHPSMTYCVSTAAVKASLQICCVPCPWVPWPLCHACVRCAALGHCHHSSGRRGGIMFERNSHSHSFEKKGNRETLTSKWFEASKRCCNCGIFWHLLAVFVWHEGMYLCSGSKATPLWFGVPNIE